MKYPDLDDLKAFEMAREKEFPFLSSKSLGDEKLIARIREWRRQRMTGDKPWMKSINQKESA